jgi:hypothetical protein
MENAASAAAADSTGGGFLFGLAWTDPKVSYLQVLDRTICVERDLHKARALIYPTNFGFVPVPFVQRCYLTALRKGVDGCSSAILNFQL